MVFIHRDHSGPRLAEKRSIGEDESEVGLELLDQATGLLFENPGVDAAAVEAEYAWEVEGEILLLFGNHDCVLKQEKFFECGRERKRGRSELWWWAFVVSLCVLRSPEHSLQIHPDKAGLSVGQR